MMKDKEQIGENAAPVDEMSAAEVDRLHALLDEAYPGPKQSARPAVEAAIRRKRIAARRARVVRWGGLAACLALLILIGVFTLPRTLVKLAPSADQAAGLRYDEAEAPAEAAEIFMMAAMPEAPEEEEADENAAPTPEAADGNEVYDAYVVKGARSLTETNASNGLADTAAETEPAAVYDAETSCSNDIAVAECEAETTAADNAEAAFLAEFAVNLCAHLNGKGDASPTSPLALIASNTTILSPDIVKSAWTETAAWFQTAYPDAALPDFTETTGLAE